MIHAKVAAFHDNVVVHASRWITHMKQLHRVCVVCVRALAPSPAAESRQSGSLFCIHGFPHH